MQRRPTVKDIYEYINKVAPFDTQESWDNSGLLIGCAGEEVAGIVVTLDITAQVVEKAAANGANLIVSHHPAIFHALKRIPSDSPVYQAARNGISVISAHTNFDAADGGVNDVLAALAGLSDIRYLPGDPSHLLRAGELPEAIAAEDFARSIRKILGGAVRYNLPEKQIITVAVCGGSGADFMKTAAEDGADAFLVGDASHHDFMDAQQLDLALLAAGHFETENPAVPVLAKKLAERFPLLSVTVSGQKTPILTV